MTAPVGTKHTKLVELQDVSVGPARALNSGHGFQIW